eukprot:161445-Hanusia_phi.AAC.1
MATPPHTDKRVRGEGEREGGEAKERESREARGGEGEERGSEGRRGRGDGKRGGKERASETGRRGRGEGEEKRPVGNDVATDVLAFQICVVLDLEKCA